MVRKNKEILGPQCFGGGGGGTRGGRVSENVKESEREEKEAREST